MSKNQDYLSIAEFAKKAGVTRQSVYKRLSTDLSTFVKEVDSKKYIHCKALELYGVKPFDKNSSTTFIDFVNYFDKQNETLSRLVDTLENELEIKNKQIADYSESLKRAHVIADQAQKLDGMTHVQALTGSTEEPVSPIDQEQKYQEMFDNSMKHMYELLKDYPEALKHLVENW